MHEKKYYNIILVAEKTERITIEKLRKKLIGTTLVDHHPPHVTLKRKFTLNDTVTEKDIINLIHDFEIARIQFSFKQPERFGDAIVLPGSSPTLTNKHTEIVSLLQTYTRTVNPEWEGKNFQAHLTIVRDSEHTFPLEDLSLPSNPITLDTLELVEMDPTPNKRFSKLIYSKNL